MQFCLYAILYGRSFEDNFFTIFSNLPDDIHCMHAFIMFFLLIYSEINCIEIMKKFDVLQVIFFIFLYIFMSVHKNKLSKFI